MSYHGDIALGSTIDVKFTTRRFSTGAPHTLAGTPAVAAYVDNGTTEITAGITLTVDFDSRTGLNNVRVVATSGNGYSAGTNVQLVITAGTVDSVSVVGEVVASFSIENRSALRPTTAGRTLDVSAGGEAGVDWANVGSPTTTVGLSGTTVKAVTDGVNMTSISGDSTAADNLEAALDGTGGVTITADVTGNITGNLSGSAGSVTGAVGSVTGNVGGNVAGSVGSVTAGVTVTTNNDKTGYRLSATGVDDILDEALTEPSAAFTWAGASLRSVVAWIGALSRNRLTQTSTTQTLRNDANSADLSTSTVSDDGTTAVRGEWT